MVPEPTPPERPRPYYAALFDSQCRSASSELLQAARFMSEDSDRRVFHRFDELRLFVLLRLQHRLAGMGAELERLRLEQECRAAKGEIDHEEDGVLDELAVDVARVLKDYDDAFVAQSRFENLRGLSSDFVHGFVEHCASDYPLLPGDLGATGLQEFRVDALASTAAREKSAVHRFVDNHQFLKRLFATKSKRRRRSSVYIYSESAIRRVERTFVHVSFCVLLLCPIIALSIIASTVGKLVVVIAFLLAASFLTSGLLTGANNTGLAVLAGYGAILIFFLGVKVDLSSN